MNDRGCFHAIAEENRDQFAQKMARILKRPGVMLFRGCRDKKENIHHVSITEEAVDRHFGQYFDRGRVLPIQMVTGIDFSHEGMKGNIVMLKKKN